MKEKIKRLLIERVELDSKGNFLCSILEDPTEDQIKEFKLKPCNHDLDVDKLIYDVDAWFYNMRYCGICDHYLGSV